MIHGFIIIYTNSHLGAKMKPYRIKKRFGGMGTYTLPETKSKLAPENGWQREERRASFWDTTGPFSGVNSLLVLGSVCFFLVYFLSWATCQPR